MEKTDFEIGDIVYWSFGPGKYKIIGTKEVPYKHTVMGDLFPLNGADFTLMRIDSDAEFVPFNYVLRNHLDLVNQ